MRHLPYQFVAVATLIGAFFVGALLNSGSEYMAEQAHKEAYINVLMALPLDSLNKMKVDL